MKKETGIKSDALTLGLLAHVDSGKTTLAEAMLYESGHIKTAGRVDHQDAFFDHYALERQRGITIFSKSARFRLGNFNVTLLDTPGHVDFSFETERALSVLDYAVLIIDASAGLRSHTMTLWRMLSHYHVPAFIFVNKMDHPKAEKEALLANLQWELSDTCLDFSDYTKEWNVMRESIAMCDEELLERYLSGEEIAIEDAAGLVAERKLFPVFFGSALHMVKTADFLEALLRLTRAKRYSESFGARVFKLSQDERGEKLAFVKITGGSLSVRDTVRLPDGKSCKVNQIRFYDGEKYETAQKADAGEVCALTGLSGICVGQGIGADPGSADAVTHSVLRCELCPPADQNKKEVYQRLAVLAEEEPGLSMSWDEKNEAIHVQVMGEVQKEILRSLIEERTGLEITFGPGHILYKETVTDSAVGIGHFEPLRHYAEVHLLLEPGERDSGIVIDRKCSEDQLERGWQKAIVGHLQEKRHLGVLLGAELTDVRITLVAGRAHKKHTEGADFREAACRAVRQGLMRASCAVLEPFFEYRMELPSSAVGRAIRDLQEMSGSYEVSADGEVSVLTGEAPAACLQDYATKLAAYSAGRGRLYMSYAGYRPCHNEAEVIASSGYHAEADLDEPSASIFCSHGVSVYVPWDQVAALAHAENGLYEEKEISPMKRAQKTTEPREYGAEEKELQDIFERTYGKKEPYRDHAPRTVKAAENSARMNRSVKAKSGQPSCLFVDGYNIIFAWERKKNWTGIELEGARNRLIEILANYRGFKNVHVVVVFDAYRREGARGEIYQAPGLEVVYTKEGETADAYIERRTKELVKNYDITVATSDALEQSVIWGHGAKRMTAAELKADIEAADIEISSLLRTQRNDRNTLLERLSAEDARFLEDLRLGRSSEQE